jgi:hypothetical protein
MSCNISISCKNVEITGELENIRTAVSRHIYEILSSRKSAYIEGVTDSVYHCKRLAVSQNKISKLPKMAVSLLVTSGSMR